MEMSPSSAAASWTDNCLGGAIWVFNRDAYIALAISTCIVWLV